MFKSIRSQLILTAFLAVIVSLFPGEYLYGQERVTGTVTDQRSGEALPGVSILMEGTGTGTVTDVEGNFEISLPTLQESLRFSYVGYQTAIVPVGGQSILTVELEPVTVAGDELVVVGYGVQRERDLTHAVSTVRAEDMNRGVMLSPQQMMQGRLAGVNIMANSGKPGGSNTVLIRGGTSATGSNEPLYVIDGVPISTTSTRRQNNINQGSGVSYFDHEPENPLNSINPNDIESITVLKDASATAIYGSRGANGVIVITTKGGRPGEMQVSYDTRFGISTMAKQLDMMSADQYRQTAGRLGVNIFDGGADTNWQDEITRSAYSHSHDIAFSGGSQATQYRASLAYGSQQGIILGSDVENLNTRVNANHSALDGRLLLDLRLQASQFTSHNAPLSNTVGGESGTNMLWDAYVFNPTLPVYDADGNFNHMSQYSVNPVSYAEQLDDQSITRRVLANTSATYQIVDPLSVNVNLAFTHQNIDRKSYISIESPLGGGFGGRATTQATEDWSQLLETTFNYQQSLGLNHELNAIAGYSHQYFVDEGYNIRATGFLSDAFRWNSIQAASTIDNVSTLKESNTLISFYGRVNYSFMDRYLLTATLRRDGSSRFGSGNEWGLFPSISAAWRIYGEEFFPQDGLFNDLKLRASYGITGNQEIGNLRSRTTLGALSSGYVIGGNRLTVVMPQQFANPDLKWEETSQIDIGLDYELLNGRIYGKMDYYIKETNDLLLNFSVPSPSVVGSQLANVGSIQNRGFEFEVGGYVLQQANRMWKVDLNLSVNRNKVLSLSDETWSTEQIVYSSPRGVGIPTGTYSQLIKPGYALGTFWARERTGIENGVEQFAEERVVGSAEPDFTFGIGNTFYYNNWDLNLNLRGSVGNDVFNNTAVHLAYLSNLPSRNVLASEMDSEVGFGQTKQYSDRFIEDGSFLRLDNVTIGYNFSVDTIPFLSRARVYMSGQNLFVITGYSGLDPEVNSDVSGSGRGPVGIDYLSYPRSRTFSIGASLQF